MFGGTVALGEKTEVPNINYPRADVTISLEEQRKNTAGADGVKNNLTDVD